MTPDELARECERRGIPYRRVGDEQVKCLDPSQLPQALREQLRQDGMLRGSAREGDHAADAPPRETQSDTPPPAPSAAPRRGGTR